MLKFTFKLIVWSVVIFGLVWLGYSLRGAEPIQAELPTFREIQQVLVDRGHDIEVDGRIGRQTIAAWDQEICNDFAQESFQ